MSQILLNQVSVSFEPETTPALHKIDLVVNEGECVLLTGHCGCGKSTLLRILNGIIPQMIPAVVEGDIHVAGITPSAASLHEIGRQIATVYQNPRMQFFCPDPLGELVFGSENAGQDPHVILTRAEEIAVRLGVDTLLNRNIFNLSGGELQRIAIASALMDQPAILLLDEPASNLDTHSIKRLVKVLQQFRASGMTLIIAEHRLWFLQTLVDRVIRLDQGHIVEDLPAKIFWQHDELRKQQGLRTLREPVLTEISTPPGQGPGLAYRDPRAGEMHFLRGHVTALLGENGVGKSTTARRLAGLESTRAEITLDGKPFPARARLRQTFLVMQNVNRQLFAQSVRQELKMSQSALTEQAFQETVRQMDLTALLEKHPLALSGGQQQRVVIALTLMEQRDVIIFDEPTSGLDYAGLTRVAALLRRLAEKGAVVILITHDEELVALCADYQALLQPDS